MWVALRALNLLLFANFQRCFQPTFRPSALRCARRRCHGSFGLVPLAVTGHRSSLYRQHLHSAPRTGRTRSRTICFAAMQSRAHIYNRTCTAADLQHDRCTRGWQLATACPRAAAEVRSATLYVYVPHAMPAFVVSKVRLVCPHLQAYSMAYSQLTVLQRTLYSDHGTRC